MPKIELSEEVLALIRNSVEKSGGEEKWHQLLEAIRRVCRARDRRGIADFARKAVKTDEGAVQFVILALCGLTLTDEILKQDSWKRSST